MSNDKSEPLLEVKNTPWYIIIGAVGGMFACLLSIVNLSAVVYYGGRYTRQVDVNTVRIDEVVKSGSPTQQAYERLASEQVSSMKTRVTTLEAVVVAMADTKGQLSVFNERFNSLTQRMQVQEERINMFIGASKK